MKKLVPVLVILFSSLSAQAAIRDRYCTIGIPQASSWLVTWSIEDEAINILINKGYRPYRVRYMDEVTSGLMLKWGFVTRKTIFGNDKRDYFGSIISKENGHEIILGSKDGGSLNSVLRSMPSCKIY